MVTAREKAFTMRRAPIATPSTFLWKPVRWGCHFGSLGDADDADIDVAQYNAASAFAPPSAIQDWSASVPGAWESPELPAGVSNPKGKPKTEPSAPTRKSPLSVKTMLLLFIWL